MQGLERSLAVTPDRHIHTWHSGDGAPAGAMPARVA
jgi:hypothetical protein